jgi:uncharacterized protein YbaA (DUF1428 family)
VRYIDTFVLPVPKKKLDEYKKGARKMAKLWMEHGAVEYVECVADNVTKGKVTSFPQSVKLKRNETVVIGWAAYKSRKHRDRVVAKVMHDPRVNKIMNQDMTMVDGKRLFFGGFETFLKR